MTYISVDVDLSEIDDWDLILELRYRHLFLNDIKMYTELFKDEQKEKVGLFLNNIDKYTMRELEELFKEKFPPEPIPKEQLELPLQSL